MFGQIQIALELLGFDPSAFVLLFVGIFSKAFLVLIGFAAAYVIGVSCVRDYRYFISLRRDPIADYDDSNYQKGEYD